jgi:hypothetical protein
MNLGELVFWFQKAVTSNSRRPQDFVTGTTTKRVVPKRNAPLLKEPAFHDQQGNGVPNR